MKTGSFFLTLVLICQLAYSQSMDSTKRYVKVPAGYLMVLKQGENIFEQLEAFARHEAIPSCNFTGMGFAEVTFGFFNPKTKEYKPKHFKAGELAAMQEV